MEYVLITYKDGTTEIIHKNFLCGILHAKRKDIKTYKYIPSLKKIPS